ncbi:hypothetical protein JHK82_020032 [Glycine max]|uniref:Uncharacterized protein n=2 Tax=Glycine subgen. Soja TaxID=1462606 RepID=K7L474_SOYBN|nr:hypothetical protein JHK87_019930 [Glycine soja]KAG5014348.1 hypothetical protein JHK85_020484 [Glycine max]KAG5024142.1 hypothetical protein JHK86_020056 [Glycine max]KAG5135301.1 hypothetical protein JHK82_020032 [Glycine max]KAH1048859.1 hypothetical protein GYH30_019781 [Glycine max]
MSDNNGGGNGNGSGQGPSVAPYPRSSFSNLPGSRPDKKHELIKRILNISSPSK